jgi:hypothetical protein
MLGVPPVWASSAVVVSGWSQCSFSASVADRRARALRSDHGSDQPQPRVFYTLRYSCRTLLPTAQPAHHSKPPVRQQDGRILSSRSGSERCVQPPPTCTSSYHHVPRGRAPQATTTTDVGEFPPREGGGDAQPNNCEQQCILLPTIALHPTVSPRQRPRLPCLGASMV